MQPNIGRQIRALAAALPLAAFSVMPVCAYNQPPFNMSATSFLDGGGGPPGLYLVEYAIFTQGDKALDKDGKRIPGNARVNVLTLLNQLVYLSNVKVLGGNLLATVLVPVVAPTARGSIGPAAVTTNTAGVGDPILGAAVQWSGSLLGKPYFHRAELDVTFPVGKYDKALGINPGSHFYVFEPYYVGTWLPDPKWDLNLKVFYAVNGRNVSTHVRPGQLLHFNFAVSRQAGAGWRVGASGYFAQQMTEDDVNGARQKDSKERVMGLGPGVVYQGKGLMLMLTHPLEFGVRNRFQGSRTTLQLIYKF